MRNLDSMLSLNLLKARELTMRRFRAIVRSGGLTDAQWRTLRVVEGSGKLSFSELAESAIVPKPSLSRILEVLEARGYVSRFPHATDLRQFEVGLTSSGKQLIDEIWRDSAAEYDALSALLLENGLEEFAADLNRYISVLERE